jgi:hypothetical protein
MSVAHLKAVLYSLFFFAAVIGCNCAAVEVEQGIVVAGTLSFVDIVVTEEMGLLGMLTVMDSAGSVVKTSFLVLSVLFSRQMTIIYFALSSCSWGEKSASVICWKEPSFSLAALPISLYRGYT